MCINLANLSRYSCHRSRREGEGKGTHSTSCTSRNIERPIPEVLTMRTHLLLLMRFLSNQLWGCIQRWGQQCEEIVVKELVVSSMIIQYSNSACIQATQKKMNPNNSFFRKFCALPEHLKMKHRTTHQISMQGDSNLHLNSCDDFKNCNTAHMISNPTHSMTEPLIPNTCKFTPAHSI